MERKTEYTDGPAGEYRIVSRPNNRWVPQKRIARNGSPTVDCWEDICYPNTKEEALNIAKLWAAGNSGHQRTMKVVAPND